MNYSGNDWIDSHRSLSMFRLETPINWNRTTACSWCLSYGTDYLLGLIASSSVLGRQMVYAGAQEITELIIILVGSISRLDITLPCKHSMFTERSCSVSNLMGKWSRHHGPPLQQIESELSPEKKYLYIITSNYRTYHRCKSCIGSVP